MPYIHLVIHYVNCTCLVSNTHPLYCMCCLSPLLPCSELLNVSFVSCWMELETAQKEDLVVNLKLSLSVPNIPEITPTLLNLAEFMEHSKVASVRWALTECALIGCALIVLSLVYFNYRQWAYISSVTIEHVH